MRQSFNKKDIHHVCNIVLDKERLESGGLHLASPETASRVNQRHYIEVGVSGFEANAGYTGAKYTYVSENIGCVQDLPIALIYASAIWVQDAVYVRYPCSPRPWKESDLRQRETEPLLDSMQSKE